MLRFQSTLPARGATNTIYLFLAYADNFNPRSPHGERPAQRTWTSAWRDFNPRSPHGERPAQRTWTSAWRDFNPRSPHGERRARRKRRSWSSPISIHAPRTGSDPCTKGGGADPAHFNPRSPHGERHGACAVADTIKRFQSTLPARGATPPTPAATLPAIISIHAPRTGSDGALGLDCLYQAISIHAPRTGSDLTVQHQRGDSRISIHAPRTGSDRFR